MLECAYPTLTESEFGKRISILFPQVSRVRRAFKGMRNYYYENLSYEARDEIALHVDNDDITSVQSIREKAVNDSLLGSENSAWAFFINGNGLLAVSGSISGANDMFQMETQVRVFQDLTWSAMANDGDVSKYIKEIPGTLKTFKDFKILLLQVSPPMLPGGYQQVQHMESAVKSKKEKTLRKEIKKSKEREKYWRKQSEYSKKLLCIADQDNEDLIKMYEKLDSNDALHFPEDPNMKILWESERKAIQAADNPSTIRWDPSIIKLCLQLWHRSKGAYEDLRQSGFVKLPSGRLLRYYKNAVDSSSCIQKERMEWMLKEANANHVSEYGRQGAITFDEMSIQEDIELKQRNGKFEIVGVRRLGDSAHQISAITKGAVQPEIATHMLQFMFVGNEGFRFPFAHFPTANLSCSHLFELFWDAVDVLHMFGFYGRLAICDGAGPNRKFVLMHFKDEKDAEEKKFTTISPATGKSVTFMIDPSHNFKKVRNRIAKSKADQSGARQYAVGENEILWDHLYFVYLYDIENNSLQTHRFLSEEHFNLTSTSKMRNHLADDVLGEDMLNLIKLYQKHLMRTQGNWKELNSTIEFLQTTSKLLKNFKHQAPYTDITDARFLENQECISWINKWKEDSTKQIGLTAKQKGRRFLPDQTKFYLYSMVLGFEKFCANMFNEFPGCGVVTGRTNQDRLENFFCSARCQNGQNNNPTVLQYESGVNAITQMQHVMSSRGNCSRPSYFMEGQSLVRRLKQ